MTLAQFTRMCDVFGDPDASADNKWKCIKSISLEGQAAPIVCTQQEIEDNEFKFINNNALGTGFVYIDNLDNNIVVSKNSKHVAFIPLSIVNAITFYDTYISEYIPESNE